MGKKQKAFEPFGNRYKRIVSALNTADAMSSFKFCIEGVLREIIEELDFKSATIRIPTIDDGIFCDVSTRSLEFCFDGLLASGCLCGEAIEGEGGITVSHLFDKQDCVKAGAKTAISAIVPLVGDEGSDGVFLAVSSKKTTPSDEKLNFLRAVLCHVGEAAFRVKRGEASVRRTTSLETVTTIGRLITSKLTLEKMTKEIVASLGAVLETDEVNVIIYDDKKRELSFLASYFADGANLERPEVHPLSDGINSWIIKNRKPLLMTYNTEKECGKLGIRHGGQPARSWLGAPMIYQGKVVGVVSVQSYQKKGLYDKDSMELLKIVAGQCAVAVENARLFEEVLLREREKERLYFSLTHDLLSLVSPISGFARLLSKTAHSDSAEASVGNILKNIIASSDKITRFVEDILVYSKIKSGKLVMNIERFDVVRCLESAIMLNMPEFSLRKLSVCVNGVPVSMENPQIEGWLFADFDVAQMERVFLNLISNSVKYSSSRIDIDITSDSSNIIFSITDDGGGVKSSELKALFDEYYQATTKKKGVGLGLPTVKKIVNLHHGSIDITSDIGEGFCVNVSWPRTLAHRGAGIFEKSKAI